MIKKRFLWALLFAALVMCGGAVYAQAPAAPEKAMVYNGESLKIQLTGMLWLEMVQNQWNAVNDTYQVWVNNQKLGVPASAFGIPNIPIKGALWGIQLPYPGALDRGSLIFDTRYSQIGLTITGPGFMGGYTFGRFETDFYGGFGTNSGVVSRQPVLRMRLAYAGIGWGGIDKNMYDVKLTFGQYYSLCTPILAMPTTLTPLPMFDKGVLFDWDQGILLSLIFGSPKAFLMIDADVSRVKSATDSAGYVTLGGAIPTGTVGTAPLYIGEGFGSNDERGPGEASMHPAFHGRIAFNLNPAPVFSMLLSVTGHFMKMHPQLAYANLATLTGFTFPYVKAVDVPSKSLGAQAKISIWIIGLQGAGWIGENMNTFTAQFNTGYRENVTGTKLLADKGRGGYAELNIQLVKVGIPLILWVHAGQEIKYNKNNIPYASATASATTFFYPLSAVGVLANSEFSGGLMWLLNQYFTLGYEFGQLDTKFKGVKGTSADFFHRMRATFVF